MVVHACIQNPVGEVDDVPRDFRGPRDGKGGGKGGGRQSIAASREDAMDKLSNMSPYFEQRKILDEHF